MSDPNDKDKRDYAENISHQAASTVIKPLVVAVADGNLVGAAVEAGIGVVKTVGSIFGLFRDD